MSYIWSPSQFSAARGCLCKHKQPDTGQNYYENPHLVISIVVQCCVFYLDLALAVVHHVVLGGHVVVGVEGGGVEGHLLHLGDAADGVGLTGARGLVLVLPVTEELLEQSGLASCW